MLAPVSVKTIQTPNLSFLLTTEGMTPVLSNPEVQKKLKAALPAAVPAEQVIVYIQKALASPVFQQALAKLKENPGQLHALIGQFGPKSAKGTDQEEIEAKARAMQEDKAQGMKVDLPAVLTPDVMAPILITPEVQAKLKSHLPSGTELPKAKDDMKTALTSPEFQQALTMLSAATASEQMQDLTKKVVAQEEAAKAAETTKTAAAAPKDDKKAKKGK